MLRKPLAKKAKLLSICFVSMEHFKYQKQF